MPGDAQSIRLRVRPSLRKALFGRDRVTMLPFKFAGIKAE